MRRIILFQPGWWVLHAVMLLFVLWLGHFVHFVK